ncbi:MAG: hypothetical protein EBX52_12110, partial [Proteobacteria bacterium]|nr:hypothetical protein [Pseudomonadota bacterium]
MAGGLSLLPSSAHAKGKCSSLLTHEFYADPETIELRADLRALCPVTHQGGLQTCWASAGATLLKPALVRAGLMRADQDLSLDYYSATVMRAFAQIYRKMKQEIWMDEIGPYYSTEVYLTLLQTGLVFRDQFHFPKLEVTSGSGKTYHTDIRTSASIREEFIDELNEARVSRKKDTFTEILDHYLGDPSALSPVPVPGSFIEAHKPQILVTRQSSLNRILDENLSSTKPVLIEPGQIETRVKASLDQGNPVMITVSRLEHFQRMRKMDFSPSSSPTEEEEF